LSKLQLQLIQQYEDDIHMHVQILRTCLLLQNKIQEDKSLRCICRRLQKQTQYMYV